MKNIQLWIELSLFLVLLLICFIGPYLPFIDRELEPTLYFKDEFGRITVPPFAPDKTFILGTDRDGRDLLSRIIVGTKETLLFVLIIVALRYILSIPLGVLSFLYKGVFKYILTTINLLFSRLPTIFTVIIIINIPYLIFSEIRPFWLLLLIALLEVGRIGETIQNQLISNSGSLYIQNGIVTGLSTYRLLLFYQLPFIIPQLIVNFVIDLGRAMLLLGQLGLFSIFIAQQWYMYDQFIIALELTSHAWPVLLKDVIRDIRLYPWIPFWATIAITYVILTFNVLGEGLRTYILKRQGN